LPITSIGNAAKALRERGSLWQHLAGAAPRRGELILAKLPKLRSPPLTLTGERRPRACGSFTLLDHDTLLCATHRSRPFLGGQPLLDEDKVNPPSRAYTKLWEALLLLGDRPTAGDTVYDLGASPGSWTWALAACGCEVIAVDKAPLDPAIDALSNVHFQQGSAFAIDPRHHHADWIFSDVICYPGRMHTFVSRWLELGDCTKFVITIKLQGDTDFDAIRAFQDLGGHVVHLWSNKHECTFIKHPELNGPAPLAWPWR
ncbi:MAG: SAM-dependent methyltransferase, partial [Planctomycetota bacterium]